MSDHGQYGSASPRDDEGFISIEELQSSYLQAQVELEEFQELAREAEAELEAELSTAQLEIEKTKHQLRAVSEMLADLRTVCEKDKKENCLTVEKLQGRVTELESENGRLRTSKRKLEEQNDNMTQSTRILEARLDQHEAELEFMIEQHSILQTDGQEYSELVAQLRMDVLHAQSALARNLKELNVRQIQDATRTQHMSDLATELAEAKKLNEDRAREIEDLRSKLALAKNQAMESDRKKQEMEKIEMEVKENQQKELAEREEQHAKMLKFQQERQAAWANLLKQKETINNMVRKGQQVQDKDKDKLKQYQEQFSRSRNAHDSIVASSVLERSARREKRNKALNTRDWLTRLTDTSLYTGSHKERFDASGRGKALSDRGSHVSDLSDIVTRGRGNRERTSSVIRTQEGEFTFKSMYVYQNGDKHCQPVKIDVDKAVNSFDRLLLKIQDKLAMSTGPIRAIFYVDVEKEDYQRVRQLGDIIDGSCYVACGADKVSSSLLPADIFARSAQIHNEKAALAGQRRVRRETRTGSVLIDKAPAGIRVDVRAGQTGGRSRGNSRTASAASPKSGRALRSGNREPFKVARRVHSTPPRNSINNSPKGRDSNLQTPDRSSALLRSSPKKPAVAMLASASFVSTESDELLPSHSFLGDFDIDELTEAGAD